MPLFFTAPEPFTAGTPLSDGPLLTAPQRNVRAFELIGAQQAPDPPRQGDTPARPARMPVYVAQNIAGIRAVQEDNFWMPRVLGRPDPWQPYGVQLPWVERANIAHQQSQAFGSTVTLVPDRTRQILLPLPARG